MLKSCVVYLPGSGGTFLHRILRLSAKVSAAEINNNVKKRFEKFTQWDSQDWKSKELYGYPHYRQGLEEYCVNEQSTSWYIDVWHPKELLDHVGVLWDQNFFESLIIIDSTIDNKEFLLENQGTKKYHLDWPEEFKSQETCKEKFSDIVTLIPFDNFFKWELFQNNIVEIDKKVNLDLPMDLVKKLWTAWFTESCKVWTL